MLVAGDGADDVGKQAGGWTLTWQGTGTKRKRFPERRVHLRGHRCSRSKAAGGKAELASTARYDRKPDVAIVVFGEDPYAEFQGDIADAAVQAGRRRRS